jgi:hypothetical protein
MQRVRDRKEDTYRCQVCGMECVSRKMAQSNVPVTKTGGYGDNATPTPAAYADEIYVATTISFTVETASDPAYLSDSQLGFADNHIQSNWSINIETIGTDLVTDGEFENWTAGSLDSWTTRYATVEEIKNAMSSGSCVEITGTDDDNDSSIYQDVTVTAEASYVLRGYYKNASGSTALYRLNDNTNDDVIDEGTSTDEFHELADSTSWKAFSYEFDAPESCISAEVAIGCEDDGEVVYFDKVTLATSGTNDGDYTIADRGVSRGTILLDDDDSLTTESAATAGEVTISKNIYEPNITSGCPHCGSLNSKGD